MSKALVVGANGQDGTILCHHLLNAGYDVFATTRRQTSDALWRLESLGIDNDIAYFTYSIGDRESLANALKDSQPDLIFFTAGNSSTRSADKQMVQILETNVLGAAEQLDALNKNCSGAKAVFFGSSEVFGYAEGAGKSADEETEHSPSNVYGLSKSIAHRLLEYRRDFGNNHNGFFEAVLFPHESELRGSEFVCQKIVKTIVSYSTGLLREPVIFGDLDSTRSWGSAWDYMEQLIDLVSGDAPPNQYVVGNGESHSVREVFAATASLLDIRLHFEEKDGETHIFDDRRMSHFATAISGRLNNAGHGYTPDSSRLQKYVPVKSESSLEEILHPMIEAQLRKVGYGRD